MSKLMSPDEKLTLCFSPCPNDTFMFDALVHQRVDTEGLKFDVMLGDVESLNGDVLGGRPDISKVSFAAFASAAASYQLLDAGSAMGFGTGPLLICRPGREDVLRGINPSSWRVAIPGKHTTANFLFSMFFPAAVQKPEFVFSEVEDAVLSGAVDAGLIIHENRFTYESRGLVCAADLGALWEKRTGQPIPLGGIAVKRSLPLPTRLKINRIMRRSVEYAMAHPEISQPYVKEHAQEMEEEVMKKHIELYVNSYSVNLGEQGKKALEIFFRQAVRENLAGSIPADIFVDVQNNPASLVQNPTGL